MKFYIIYPNHEGKEVHEDFTTKGHLPPPHAYAAMGCNGSKAGDLLMMRLCRGGTSLVMVHNAKGKQARTHRRHAGKTFIEGEWQNQ